MRFKRYLEEDASQLAIPGMSTKRPHVFGSNNPDVTLGKECPPDKVWNEVTQKCETALGTQGIFQKSIQRGREEIRKGTAYLTHEEVFGEL